MKRFNGFLLTAFLVVFAVLVMVPTPAMAGPANEMDYKSLTFSNISGVSADTQETSKLAGACHVYMSIKADSVVDSLPNLVWTYQYIDISGGTEWSAAQTLSDSSYGTHVTTASVWQVWADSVQTLHLNARKHRFICTGSHASRAAQSVTLGFMIRR